MNRTLWLINGACIVVFLASAIWTGMALGTDAFEQRHVVTLLTMLPCLGFIVYRRMKKRT